MRIEWSLTFLAEMAAAAREMPAHALSLEQRAVDPQWCGYIDVEVFREGSSNRASNCLESNPQDMF